jgi:acyl-CoA synthetase (AMP-forming)/AMP-acid ligase II
VSHPILLFGRSTDQIDRLVDDHGNEITKYGTRGELLIRGPTVFMGYAKTLNKTHLDKDGFFATGDICYCDERTQKWYIVDRKKVDSSPVSVKCINRLRHGIGLDQSQWIPSCSFTA